MEPYGLPTRAPEPLGKWRGQYLKVEAENETDNDDEFVRLLKADPVRIFTLLNLQTLHVDAEMEKWEFKLLTAADSPNAVIAQNIDKAMLNKKIVMLTTAVLETSDPGVFEVTCTVGECTQSVKDPSLYYSLLYTEVKNKSFKNTKELGSFKITWTKIIEN